MGLEVLARSRNTVKVLVTGGCGYVGTKLTEALLTCTPHEIDVLDIQWFGNHLKSHPRLTVHHTDLCDFDGLDLSAYDTIFHLANIANDPSVDLDPYTSWKVNVLATMRLIDAAARRGARQFIFASSASVYGLKQEERVTEDLELCPLSEYNRTKMVAERVVLSYSGAITTTVVRPATVCGYSPRMRLDTVVNMLTMQALTKGIITVLGGGQVRPVVHIDDLIDLYLFAFEHRLAGVYNAGFENLTVMDIASIVARELGARVEVLPSNDPRSYRVCSDRLLATGFVPRRDVTMAIREIAQAYRDGWLRDDAHCNNVKWMTANSFK